MVVMFLWNSGTVNPRYLPGFLVIRNWQQFQGQMVVSGQRHASLHGLEGLGLCVHMNKDVSRFFTPPLVVNGGL